MENQNDVSEEIIMYSDEEDSIGDEVAINQQQTQTKSVQSYAFRKIQNCPFELLYIIFAHYRKDIEEIAKDNFCKFKVAISSYSLACEDPNKKDLFNACLIKVQAFINSINYDQLMSIGKKCTKQYENTEKYKYNHSLYFQQLLRNKKINLIIFHDKLYGFSRQLKKAEIKAEISTISKNKSIYSLRFVKNPKNRPFENTSIHRQLNLYLQKVINYHKQTFQQKEVIVEINKTKNYLYIIGQRAKYLMQCKIIMKNVIQSLVGIIISNTTINEKELTAFFSKASTYPIHFGRINQNGFIIISKDNIFKQLLKKSQYFYKYAGICVKDQEGNKQFIFPKIGIFLIPSHTIGKKIDSCREKCKPKGYDLYRSNNVRYLNKVFVQKPEDEATLKYLLSEIMVSLQESKEKFQLGDSPKRQNFNKALQVENPLKYFIKGGKEQHKELSKLFKRDVLTEKVQMKKEYLIAFNCIETKEEVVYFTITKNGEQDKQLRQSELKLGKYFKGRRRISQEKGPIIIFDEIITIL